MAYERIKRPKGAVYHYTKRENLDGIRKDGRLAVSGTGNAGCAAVWRIRSG